MDGDGAGDVAVLDGTGIVVTHDAARYVIGGDGAAGQREVLHLGALDEAEEALIFIGRLGAALIDDDAADGVTLAVEVAAEGVVVVAYCGIVAASAVEVESHCAVVEVAGEFEVLAAVTLAGVDALGEEVELVGGADEVGLALAAVLTVCPVAEDVAGDDGSLVGQQGHVVGAAADVCEAVGVSVGVCDDLAFGSVVSNVEADGFGFTGVECGGGAVAVDQAAVAVVGGDAAEGVCGLSAGGRDGHVGGRADGNGLAGAFLVDAVEVEAVGRAAVSVGCVVVVDNGVITLIKAYDGSDV